MKLSLFILALATLGSCAKHGPDAPQKPGGDGLPVRFATEVQTRGTSITQDNIQEFGVFCYDLNGTTWNPATSLPNKMDNLKVTRIANTPEWTYGSSIDWEGGDGRRFSFLGYSPHATGTYQDPDNTGGNNLTVTTPVAGIPILKYETLADVPSQIDLLLATPHISITPQEKVHMKFDHALTQVRFRGRAAQQGTRLLSIAIYGVQYKGTVAATSQPIAWTVESDTTGFSAVRNFPPITTNPNFFTDLTAGGNAFMLLPQDLTQNTEAKIVITAIVSGVESVKTHIIKENWEAGNSYTYTVELGGPVGEEITVTGVTITPWTIDPNEEELETNPTPP